jgi:acyl-CoA reductase-like NAD-dependent aldehyde dehydrogenase
LNARAWRPGCSSAASSWRATARCSRWRTRTPEDVFARVAAASPEQVDGAIAAASAAARAWAATPAVERAELLHEVAARLRARTDELAELMSREGGKPRVENADEISWTAAAFDYYAEIGRNSAGRVIPSIESTQLALVLKEPIGVVAAIVPWNYPLLLLAWKLAPALAAGNPVVCKPSELTPLSTLALAGCVDHLPPGVVSILAGAGDVGGRIVADPRIGCVAFTGSTATGKRIAHACVDRVARINLEMGGKDPSSSCPTSPSRSASRRGEARGRRSSTPARCARRPSASTSRSRSTTTSSPRW